MEFSIEKLLLWIPSIIMLFLAYISIKKVMFTFYNIFTQLLNEFPVKCGNEHTHKE